MKVSVVTLCLNGAPFLTEALESVAGQDWPEIEHLVLDGGSTDGSVDIIRDFAGNHPKLRWWSEPDDGISDAMNRGIMRASGELVAFLHADDRYCEPSVLSAVIERMAASPAAWLTGGVLEIDQLGRPLRVLPARRYSYRRLLRNNILFHPATFVRRNTLLAAGGFDAGLRYAMDYDLWLRLAAQAPPVVVDRVLTCFRVHAGSRSTSHRMAALDEEYQVRKRYLSGTIERCLHACYQSLRRSYESRAARRNAY